MTLEFVEIKCWKYHRRSIAARFVAKDFVRSKRWLSPIMGFTDQSRGADLQYQVVWLLLRAKKIPTVKQVGILSFTTLPKV